MLNMLRLEIVTPEKRVLDAEVDSVTVPTASGEVGLLASHAPLISAVKPGLLGYTVKGSVERLAVSGGFVEVSGDKISVLVDAAERADEIDQEDARSRRDEAEKGLAAAGLSSAEEASAARELIDHAAARLALAAER